MNLILQRIQRVQRIENISDFFNALQACLAILEHFSNGLKFLVVTAFECDDGLQLLDLLFRKTILTKFGIHVVETDLVEFVDGDGDIHNLVGSPDDLSDAGKDLAVVDLDEHADTETGKDGIDNLHQFHLVEQGVRADDIAVELPELTIAALLRTVSTPNGLHLIALERQLQFLAVHHHVAGEGHGKIVAQTFLTEFGGEVETVALGQFLGCNLREVIAAIENLEEQFVAFFAIFAHQGAKCFHCRRLNLLEAVELVNLLDGIKDIITLGHLHWREVARSLRYAWFLCHYFLTIVWSRSGPMLIILIGVSSWVSRKEI